MSNSNISDIDRLGTAVRRLRRIEAHPLIVDDCGDRIRHLYATELKPMVYDHRTDPSKSYCELAFDLPNEVQFESLAARLRPLTLENDVIGHKRIMDSLDALTDTDDLAVAHGNANLRGEWVEATRRDRKNRGAIVRAFRMSTGEVGNTASETATDVDLAYAWLYEDSLHADVPTFDEFSARDRYQAATHVFSHVAVVALETLAYIRWLVTEGHLDLPEEVFTVDVVVSEPKWEMRGQIYVGEPGATSDVDYLSQPPAGMQTIQDAMRPMLQAEIDAAFEATAPIGDAIHAVAQAEEVFAEAEEMPTEIAARMDNFIDELTGGHDDD